MSKTMIVVGHPQTRAVQLRRRIRSVTAGRWSRSFRTNLGEPESDFVRCCPKADKMVRRDRMTLVPIADMTFGALARIKS
jgi:ABC-type proline/glycine betaine transport system ATPase subunit